MKAYVIVCPRHLLDEFLKSLDETRNQREPFCRAAPSTVMYMVSAQLAVCTAKNEKLSRTSFAEKVQSSRSLFLCVVETGSGLLTLCSDVPV